MSPPQERNITCLVRKFEETESAADIQRSGRPSTATTPQIEGAWQLKVSRV